ncbi:MAG: hypothetical protein SCM96_07450 [Acidobacteriota bacterium]|nr:hypothetical protein [Acidobacteriota bacterium]
MAGSPAAGFLLASLMRNQWKSPEALNRIRVAKTRRLLIHAFETVPFYRSRFQAAGADPYEFKTMEDLGRFPLVSKEDLRDRAVEDVTSASMDRRRCEQFSTSGATGVPLRSFFDRRDSMLKNLAWIRVFLNSGMKPWHKAAAFMGSRNVKSGRSWYEFLGLWRRCEISTWSPPSCWIEALRIWQPQVLLGYVMTLKVLADHMGRNGHAGVRPKLIFHSSAVLDSLSRNFLEERLGGTIIDIYGSDEAGCIAWECRVCRGYHISADMLVVEVLKNGRPVAPGESGEVVVTNLHSFAMPFIRYRQNDMVTLASRRPVCGRRFPLIEMIEGRIDDFITLENGRKLSPHPVYHAIDPVPGINRWKLTQESRDCLVLEIEPGAAFDPESERLILDNLRTLTEGNLRVHILLRENLPIDPGSKFRTVTSKVRE